MTLEDPGFPGNSAAVGQPALPKEPKLADDLRFFATQIYGRPHRTPWEDGMSKLLTKAADALSEPVGQPDLRALQPILDDMQRASDLVDEANGTSDYSVRLIALALISRHFLRELAALLAAQDTRETTNTRKGTE